MIDSYAFESADIFPRVDLDLTIERPCVDVRDVGLSTSCNNYVHALKQVHNWYILIYDLLWIL